MAEYLNQIGLLGVPIWIWFGVVAGLFQATGYAVYYLTVIRKDGKEEEPLTWLMFGYGTALLTIMEFDSMYSEAIKSSSWLGVISILFLPVICSLGAVLVAYNIWRKNFSVTKALWPKSWTLDWKTKSGIAFGVDILLTFGYVALWIMTSFIIQNGETHLIGVIVFLLISNATTIPGFVPMVISTAKNPEREDYRPWFVWSIAYTLLAVPTFGYASDGVVWPSSWLLFTWDASFWYFLALMSYPVPNAVFHLAVGVLALPYRQKVIKPAE